VWRDEQGRTLAELQRLEDEGTWQPLATVDGESK